MGDMAVRKTSFEHFLRDADCFWTMSFPTAAEARKILERRFDHVAEPLTQSLKGTLGALALAGLVTVKALAVSAILDNYGLFTPAEIQRRARSRLGEHSYNLAIRNCEHFAFWCATGLSTSQQVEGLLYGGAALVAALVTGKAGNALDTLVDPAGRESLGGEGLFRRSEPIPADLMPGARGPAGRTAGSSAERAAQNVPGAEADTARRLT